MLKDFYKKALPDEGYFCVAHNIPNTKHYTHDFVTSIDQAVELVEKYKEKQQFFGVKGTFHDRPWWGLESLKNINASSGQKSQKLDP